jgi:hypothetical protein
VKPGETVSWKACKGAWTLYGSQVYTIFRVGNEGPFIVLSNENPLTGGAKAWSEIYEVVRDVDL